MSKRPKATAAPACPAIVKGAARVEWRRVVSLLAADGPIRQLDRAALTAYCLAWARWTLAEAKVVETGGEVVKSPNGYPIQNPWIGIANTAQKQMHAMIRELGLSPASRKRKPTKAPAAAPQNGSKLQVYLTGGNGNDRA